jgi:hypothetical protein
MIEQPDRFFARLGGLHDARIRRIAFDPASATLSLGLDDLDSNQAARHRERRPAQLDFSDVRFVEGEFADSDVHEVFELDVGRDAAGYRASLRLAPEGRVVWTFATVAIA